MFDFFKKSSKNTSSGVFVARGGELVEYTEPIEDSSFNGIVEQLGIPRATLHSYIATDIEGIDIAGFEIFTENLVLVLTERHVTQITNGLLRKIKDGYRQYLSLGIYTPEDFLTEGIESGELTSEFLKRVLGLGDAPEYGYVHSARIDMYLEFANGVLCDFRPSDGLSQWARELKSLNLGMLNSYFDEAAMYWGDNRRMIEKEVNLQAEAIFDTPNTIENPYCDLHRTPAGNINFVNLVLAHYGGVMTVKEFLEVNHGRYEVVIADPIAPAYRVGQMIFLSDGQQITGAIEDTGA